ncbi:MAG: SAM-dependent methyltransferase [Firmicutes bacterium]|nr:SAM-dependent methyltransferase [Bacillota bacterium]
MFILSKRLLAVSEMTGKVHTIADIGTDHAYLPVHLLKTGKADFAVCCDINKGPLDHAEKTVRDNNLSEKVSLRLGSGLAPLAVGEAEMVFICGMGGSLIIDIIEADREKALSAETLILQPQNDVPKVRKYLTENGFAIKNEKMVFDGGFYYTILSVKKGISPNLSKSELLLGPCLIKEKPPVFLDYLKYKIEKLQALSDTLSEKDTPGARAKQTEIQHQLTLIKEVL